MLHHRRIDISSIDIHRSSDSKNPSTSKQRRSGSYFPVQSSNWKLGCLIFLSLLSLMYFTQRKDRREKSFLTINKPIFNAKYSEINDASLSRPTLYQCPEDAWNAVENVATAPKEHYSAYETESSRISNISTYMDTFRDLQYDDWGHTYNEVKQIMFPWKSRYFSELKSGDIIYESACGIGMNLFMTLEILYEVLGITNITIYGNDYVPESVQVALAIYSDSNVLLPKSFGGLGSICTADSKHLEFVPSNTFDLVYTGYISPLLDPLHLNHSTTDEKFVQYNAYCEQKDALSQVAQELQNDWYGAWVGEMIRIAKPGAPIIVEQASSP